MGFLLNEILLLFILPLATAFYHYKPLMSEDVEFALYGNITSLQDLVSISLNHSQTQGDILEDKSFYNTRRSLIEKEIQTLDLMDDMDRKNEALLPDTKDYNDVNKMINSMSGRRKFRNSYNNYHDRVLPRDLDDDQAQGNIEEEKLDMLGMCGLQFLIHTRVRIKRAMSTRSAFKGDKRYMLGYLFNRMRRILYEQRKIVNAATQSNRYANSRRLRAMLRFYQQVVRYDIDLVDLERYIRRVYQKPAKFDHIVDTR